MFESSATKRRKAKEKAAVIAAALEAQNKAVPIIYTSVPGQKLTPALQEMQTSLAKVAQSNDAFDLQLAQRWMTADKKLGNFHYTKKVKKAKKRGVKKKKQVNYEENSRLKQAHERAKQAKAKMRREALRQRLETRSKLVSVSHDSVCRWTFYDRGNRIEYRCTNARQDHPLTAEQSNYCKYHMTFCLNDHSAMHGKILRPLEVQNKLALCQICYKQEARGQPRPIPDLEIPGVATVDRTMNARLALITNSAVPKPVAEMLAQGVGLDGEEMGKKKEEKSIVIQDRDDGRPICRWTRKHPKTKERWRCHCKVIKILKTKSLGTECGWHQAQCIGFHMSKSPPLVIPNELGLCPAHYAAKKGSAPKNYGDEWWDLPVVKAPPKKNRVVPRKNKLAPPGLHPDFKFPGEDSIQKLYSDVENRKLTFIEKLKERIKFKIEQSTTRKKYLATRKLIKYKYTRIQKGKESAISIQRIFRGFIRRDDIDLIRDHARYLKRRNAVIQLQAWVRFMQGSLMAFKWLDERSKAAAAVNRVARGMLARRYTVRLIATRLLQRIARGFNGRCKAGGQRAVQTLRNQYMDRQWAIEKLLHVVKGWIQRRHDPGPMARDASMDEPSAIQIQRVWRGMLGRLKATVQKEWIVKYHFVIGWVQRHWRGIQTRAAFGAVFVPLRTAAMFVQRAYRGYKGRCAAGEERDVVEKGWNWLDPALPRDVLVRFMPRFGYGKGIAEIAPKRPFSHKLQKNEHRDTVEYLQQCIDDAAKRDSFKNKSDNYKTLTRQQQKEAAIKRIAAKKRWPSKPFKKFDIDDMGSISRSEFRKGLHKCGHYLSTDQTWTLMNRFDVAQNGLVDYVSFLEYVRRQDRPCTKHRIYGCADCVMYKGCIKDTCGCHRYRAPMQTGNGVFMKALICECGHYMTQHALVPKDRLDKDYVEGEGYSAKQLKAMLTFEAPHFIPEKIYGVELEEMQMTTGYTRIDLKATLNCVDDRIVTRIVPEPFEADSKYDSRAMFRFQRLYSDIIASIIDTSQSTVNDLNGSLDWNQTTNPRISNTGDILAHGWKFHPVGNAVAPPKLSDGAVQKKKDMADAANAKKAAVTADPRSNSNKIRSRLAEAKVEAALLLPYVSANNTDMETYEIGHTITRPLPLISHGELRLTIDVIDIYIDVLLTLIDPNAGVMEDDQQLTLYVYNLFTFFDRHWKHLISDLRMGTLNPELPVDDTTRSYIELHLAPAPARARHLDNFLRTVGFHRRASNAKFKQDHLKLEDGDEEDNNNVSKLSIIEETEDDVDHTSALNRREVMSDDGSSDFPQSSPQDRDREQRKKQVMILTPRSARGRPSTTVPTERGVADGSTTLSLPLINQQPRSAANTPRSDTEYTLSEIGDDDYDSVGLGLDRPRSADDVRLTKVKGIGAKLRAQTINESFHEMASAPQEKDIKINRVYTRKTKPFVCDHPGCGAAFTDPRLAAMHQKEQHAGQPRVVAKAKRLDQLLRPYWPKQVPWLHTWSPHAREKVKQTTDHGKRYVSALSGKRFLLHKQARAELSYFERNVFKNEIPKPDNRYTILEKGAHVPPGSAPARAQIHICKKHWPNKRVPSKCLRCKATKAMIQPRLPCMFFHKFRAKIPIIDDIGEASFDEIVFSTDGDASMLPLIHTDLGEATPVEIVALAKDCRNQYWIAYSRFWDVHSLTDAEYKTKHDFMSKYELLKETETKWAKLDAIVGSCFVIDCSRAEFRDRLKRKMLPTTGKVFFHRDSFASSFYEGRMIRRDRKAAMQIEAAANIAALRSGKKVVKTLKKN